MIQAENNQQVFDLLRLSFFSEVFDFLVAFSVSFLSSVFFDESDLESFLLSVLFFASFLILVSLLFLVTSSLLFSFDSDPSKKNNETPS